MTIDIEVADTIRYIDYQADIWTMIYIEASLIHRIEWRQALGTRRPCTQCQTSDNVSPNIGLYFLVFLLFTHFM